MKPTYESVSWRRARMAAAFAALAAVTTALLSVSAADAAQHPAPATDPPACSIIDFDTAVVTPDPTTSPIRYRLTVSGMKPSTNMTVELVPHVYIRQPEFWGIQVNACSSGIGMPAFTPYTATYDFSGPMGACGVEVVGAVRSQKLDLAGCAGLSLADTRWVLDRTSLGVPVPEGRTITAGFSATTVSGSTSCNSYSANYSTGSGGMFTVKSIATTKRACIRSIARAERTYLAKLSRSKQFQVSQTQLLLLGGNGRTLLRFTPVTTSTPA